MRKLVYVLSNGTIETTEKSAKESGLEYTTAFQEMTEEKAPLLPLQKLRRIKLN